MVEFFGRVNKRKIKVPNSLVSNHKLEGKRVRANI